MTLDHPSARTVFAISGIDELGPLRETYVNDKRHLSDGELATLSPLRLPPIDRPLTLAYGTADLPVVVEDSRSFHMYRNLLLRACALVPVPQTNHFSVLEDLRARNGILTRFLKDIAAVLDA